MSDTELFCWWVIAMALSVLWGAVHLGVSLARRRQRLDPFDLLGAEVRRLNTKKTKSNP